jgi:rhodanese-related sulfurtransferase
VRSERINPEDYDAVQGHSAPVVLLDVRAPGEYEQGAIPGSVNIPLPQLRERIVELQRDHRIVVNCASGWRSAVATSYLNAKGFAATDLRGGYDAWARVAA